MTKAVDNTPFTAVGNYQGIPLSNILVIYDEPQAVSGGYSYRYDLITNSFNGYIAPYYKDAFLTVPSKITYATTLKSGSANFYDDIWLLLEDGTTRIIKNNRSNADCFSNALLKDTGLGIVKDDVFSFADFNGDGLLDVLFRKNTNDWKIGVNRGNDTYRIESSSVVFCQRQAFSQESDRVIAVDINNDGLPDLAVGDEESADRTTWRFYLNKGNGTFSPWWKTLPSSERAAYACMADIYGKGRVSWVYAPSKEKVIICNFGFSPHRNLLTKVENPVSPPLELTYRPQAECKFKEWTREQQKSYVSQGYIPYKTTLSPVLWESNDGLNRIKYDYGVALINWSHRGYMGFLNQKEYDVTNNVRTEATGILLHSGTLYNVMHNSKSCKYIGETETTPYVEEYNWASIKPLGGKRFVLQPYHYIYKDNSSKNIYAELYTYDEYNNVTRYTKESESQTVVTESVYSQYGAWCPNVTTKETTTETFGSDVFTRVQFFYYNANGNRTSHSTDSGIPGAVLLTNTYDEFGNPLSTLKLAASVRTSRRTYSASGRFMTSETDELSQKTTYEWDEVQGLLLKEITRIGTTSYTYDNFGNLITTTYPDGRKKNQSTTWASSGVPGCKYMTTVTTDGHSLALTWYNAYGQEIARKITGVNAKDIYTFTEYQSDGKTLRVSKPTYNSTPAIEDWAGTYEYDSYGRIKKVTTPKGIITTTYGQRKSSSGPEYHLVKTVTAPDSKTETIHSEDGLLLQSTVNGKAVTFSYTVGGKIKTATPEGGLPVTFQYDRHGNRTSINDPNTGIIGSKYDVWGQLIEEIQAIHGTSAPQIVTYTYSANGLLSKKTRGNMVTNYVYDLKKRLTRVYNTESERSFIYDTYDRVTEVSTKIDGRTLTSKKEYDTYGQITKEIYPDGYYITNHYDQYGNLMSVTDGASRQIWQLLTCDAEGRVLTEKKGNVITTYRYDKAGRLDSIAAPGIVDMRYTYYATGNLKSYKDAISNQIENYTYDNLDRLTGWKTSNDTYPFNNIDYDASVNRVTYKYDRMKPESSNSYSYGISDKPYALTTLSNCDLPEQKLTYTDFKKVASIRQGDYAYTFSYGPDDELLLMQRADKGIISSKRYYAENFETDDYNQKTRYHYIHGGNGLAAIYINSQYTNFLTVYTDILGSLVALAQGSTVAERYAYNPWGKRRNPQVWMEKDLRSELIAYRGYTMHEHLDEIGLINMKARLYDPYVGLFLSPDPQLQAPDNWLNYNRYGYCMNNPLKYTDPDGEFFHFIIGAIVGGLFNWATHGCKFNAKGLAYFGVGAVAGAVGAGIGSGITAAISGAQGATFGAGFLSGTLAQAGSSSFLSGALVGGGIGLSGGFATGLGNGIVEGQSFGRALGQGALYGLAGGVSGAIVGGIVGGISAAKDGRRFWDGATVNDNVLMEQNIPLIGQAKPDECLIGSAEAVDKSFGGNMTQQDILNLQGVEREATGGFMDVKVWKAYTNATKRQLLLSKEPSLNNTLLTMKKNGRIAFTLKSSPIDHSVVVKSVIQRTITRAGKKAVDKILYNIMDPAQGGYFRIISEKRVVNSFYIF